MNAWTKQIIAVKASHFANTETKNSIKIYSYLQYLQ